MQPRILSFSSYRRALFNGEAPEEIASGFGHLSLAQAHAALAYYHANKAEIDADLEAGERACVLYSRNASDFHRLHGEWVRAGREHAGMFLAPQQRLSAGEQLRRNSGLRATASAESMRNRLEFLSNWG